MIVGGSPRWGSSIVIRPLPRAPFRPPVGGRLGLTMTRPPWGGLRRQYPAYGGPRTQRPVKGRLAACLRRSRTGPARQNRLWRIFSGWPVCGSSSSSGSSSTRSRSLLNTPMVWPLRQTSPSRALCRCSFAPSNSASASRPNCLWERRRNTQAPTRRAIREDRRS